MQSCDFVLPLAASVPCSQRVVDWLCLSMPTSCPRELSLGQCFVPQECCRSRCSRASSSTASHHTGLQPLQQYPTVHNLAKLSESMHQCELSLLLVTLCCLACRLACASFIHSHVSCDSKQASQLLSPSLLISSEH
jgi:hypothetical protein